MMGRGCGGREEEVDRQKGIVEVVSLVVSACKSPLAPLSLPLSFRLYESPPALHCFINTHLYPGPPLHLLSPLSLLVMGKRETEEWGRKWWWEVGRRVGARQQQHAVGRRRMCR